MMLWIPHFKSRKYRLSNINAAASTRFHAWLGRNAKSEIGQAAWRFAAEAPKADVV
jgi:hypothetical protein